MKPYVSGSENAVNVKVKSNTISEVFFKKAKDEQTNTDFFFKRF